MADIEIKILELGLALALIQSKINKQELRRDIESFFKQMRLKWRFRDEPASNLKETPSFRTTSSWNSPKGSPNFEIYLRQVEGELFKVADSALCHF